MASTDDSIRELFDMLDVNGHGAIGQGTRPHCDSVAGLNKMQPSLSCCWRTLG